MEIFAYSHIGSNRDNHEDNYWIGKGRYLTPYLRKKIEKSKKCLVDTFNVEDNEFCCFISDGMGGYGYGERASLSIVEFIDCTYNFLLEHSTGKEIESYFEKMNEYILDKKRSDIKYKEMGATLCGVVVLDNKIIGINVGDSGLYRFSYGKLEKVSVDNTEGRRLLDLGLLTEDEEKNFPNRKAIYKYIGKNIKLVPDLYYLEKLCKDEMLLICSDGLSDSMSISEMEDILNMKNIRMIERCKFLVEVAIENRMENGDNITLVVIS